jgi:F0F1-type ATP synthase membrane subunit b/b'
MSLELLAQVSQIAGAVVFVVVAIWIWNKYVAPGVKAYQASKNAELAEAEARREKLRADVAAAQGEVTRADADAAEIRARIERATARDRTRALDEAKAEGERLVRNAEGELERARIAARARLRIELIEKALAKARAEAPLRVGDATNKALVDATVDDLARGRG